MWKPLIAKTKKKKKKKKEKEKVEICFESTFRASLSMSSSTISCHFKTGRPF
jgi:hypothetical protein